MLGRLKAFVGLWVCCLPLCWSMSIFEITMISGDTNFPGQIGLNKQPLQYVFQITNNTDIDLTGMTYEIPGYFVKTLANTTCGPTLNKRQSCQIAVMFRPNLLGQVSGSLEVCAGNGLWCSEFPRALAISVIQTTITVTNCDDAQSRPFSSLTCNGSQQLANTMRDFMTQVIGEAPIQSKFYYYQHIPSVTETTTACLDARQENVGLDANIKGGGAQLCSLMGYATSNASAETPPTDVKDSKQYPEYFMTYLGTDYPVTTSTTPLDNLSTFLTEFGTTALNTVVRQVGYTGQENFLTSYYLAQLTKTYSDCGGSETCPAIVYLPFITASKTELETWPLTTISYSGSSGGGGSGNGFQIGVFQPNASTHTIVFSGGGGGGGGNTSPENIQSGVTTTLINVGSGGGGGMQFADVNDSSGDSLSGLGLGAGTNGGVSTDESTNISYLTPPAVEFSYYKPATHPEWSDATTLTNYGDYLEDLFKTKIPAWYNDGNSIVLTGGGGGGTGLEFLDADGAEYKPHPVSIGHGFSYCYVWNKNNSFNPTDCISTATANSTSLSVDEIIYQNIGLLYHQGMQEAILPANCDGYQNFKCTCNYQYNYVITNLGDILEQYGYPRTDIPKWLDNPHCGS